jgi:hypothetical protein
MYFSKPELFNGDQFQNELKENNIEFIGFVFVEGEEIKIETNENNKKKIEDLIKLHKPKPFIDHRKNALAKLAALGLTEEEIAAL